MVCRLGRGHPPLRGGHRGGAGAARGTTPYGCYGVLSRGTTPSGCYRVLRGVTGCWPVEHHRLGVTGCYMALQGVTGVGPGNNTVWPD
eukprot:1180485-Prorocentrum_minimum.AAC.1